MHSYTFSDSNLFYKTDEGFTLVNSGYISTASQSMIVQSSAESELPSRTDQLYESDLAQNSLLIIPLIGWFALLTSLLISFFRSEKVIPISGLQAAKQKESILTKQAIPCGKCRYFSSNSYVPCAVHPSKALTVEAVDCADYCSR
ncbi:MAG: hypothetical protein KME11_10860 [Timaviella obliquedivisa GSE-PSE-MK23-08B]|nr:hypothetical protein [Timaviella obliquedivisa GSE-PSE-MK23-08B]